MIHNNTFHTKKGENNSGLPIYSCQPYRKQNMQITPDDCHSRTFETTGETDAISCVREKEILTE